MKNIILAGLDLGAANLHTRFGVLGRTPAKADFMLTKISLLEDTIIETPVNNLCLMSGAGFVPDVTNPAYSIDRCTVL